MVLESFAIQTVLPPRYLSIAIALYLTPIPFPPTGISILATLFSSLFELVGLSRLRCLVERNCSLLFLSHVLLTKPSTPRTLDQIQFLDVLIIL